MQHGVVGAIRGGKRAHQLKAQLAINYSTSVAAYFAFRLVARPAQTHAPARGNDHAHGHLVLRERAGFVGGDNIRRAERFNCGEMAHDGVALRHALHADGEHRGDHCRQTFRHCCNGERDTQDEHIENSGETAHIFDENDRGDHHNGDDDDDKAEQFTDVVEFLLQRCGLFRRCLQHTGNAPHLSLHSSRHHHRASASVSCCRAAENHVVTVAKPDFFCDRQRIFSYRHTLTGQRRFRRLQRDFLNQSRVRRDSVALFNENDVAGHDLGRRNILPLTFTDDIGMRCRHLAQRRHRFFRA
ncbi:MAG: hypothetical protein ALAOOOJD_01560 [bacterium]|nr:hypothetical protein [bacterium]